LRGDYFKAVLVAYDDFSNDLKKKKAIARPKSEADAKMIGWISRIESYDIDVVQTVSTIEVQFSHTLREDAPIVFGGGARYVIDRKSFSITSKTLLK
jgi:hypothetical protein